MPHVGWNNLLAIREHPVFDSVKRHVDYYFVHSYHCVVTDPSTVVARCDYGGEFVAAVGRENVVGTQFHPEKSQAAGLRLIANFLAWAP